MRKRIQIGMLWLALMVFAYPSAAQQTDLQSRYVAYDMALSEGRLDDAPVLAQDLVSADFSETPLSAFDIRNIRTGLAETLWAAGKSDLALLTLSRVVTADLVAFDIASNPKDKSFIQFERAKRLEQLGDWNIELGRLDPAINHYEASRADWLDMAGPDMSVYYDGSGTTGHRTIKVIYAGQIVLNQENKTVSIDYTRPPSLILDYVDGFEQRIEVAGSPLASENPSMTAVTAKLVSAIAERMTLAWAAKDYRSALTNLHQAIALVSEQCGNQYPSRREYCGDFPSLDILDLDMNWTRFWMDVARQLEARGDLEGAYRALDSARSANFPTPKHLDQEIFQNRIKEIEAEQRRIIELAKEQGYDILEETVIVQSPPYQPTPAIPNFETVKVFYGTNRAQLNLFEVENAYSSDRGSLVWGSIDMTVPRNREIGDLGALGRGDKNGAIDGIHIVLKRIQPVSQSDFSRKLRASISQSRYSEKEAFIYVHGHGVTFANAARRTAQLAVDLDIRGGGTFFSWPAGNPSRGYRKSESEVETASFHLAEFITRIVNESGADKLHIFAHSMGNRILMPALEQVQANGELQSTKPFDQIVWASPDNDASRFAASISKIAPLAEDMTLYASRNDQALRISKWVMHSGRPRAGQSPVHSDILDQSEYIDAIDTSSVGGENDRLGHTDYVGGAITDLQSIVWLSLEPDQRCINSVTNEDGVAVFWRTEYQSCSVDELRRALITMRHQGAEKALNYAQSSLQLSDNAEDGSESRTWRGAIAIMNQLADSFGVD